MSTLIILGNTNRFTFANSIVAANGKAIEKFDEALTDIFVIHSTDSQATLSSEVDWIAHLESNGISQEIITHQKNRIHFTKNLLSDLFTILKSY